jgi:hypothetical protein
VGVPTPINSTSPTTGKKGSSRANSPASGGGAQGQRMRKETDADQIDFNKKILHMSWHPFEDSIAIAATNNVGFPLLLNLGTRLTFTALRLLRPLERRHAQRTRWKGLHQLSFNRQPHIQDPNGER